MSYKILEHELAYFITWLLEANDDFRNINSDSILDDGHRADIIVEEKREGNYEPLLIELKASSNFTEKILNRIIKQINSYRGYLSSRVNYAICFPGLISPEDEIILKKYEIDVWDLNYVQRRFHDQIALFPFEDFVDRFNFISGIKKDSKNKELIEELKNVKAGKKEWYKYQKLVGEILEFLFGDKLSNPIIESSDGPNVNRRDFIFRNYVESGFWNYLRSQYKADFIVIDAKNYKDNIGKGEVIQIANYLKEKGTGLFAIIITRNGENPNSLHTRQSKWLIDNKMIIVLNDDDLEKMILAKISSDDPEEIIKQKIEEFRLSL